MTKYLLHTGFLFSVDVLHLFPLLLVVHLTTQQHLGIPGYFAGRWKWHGYSRTLQSHGVAINCFLLLFAEWMTKCYSFFKLDTLNQKKSIKPSIYLSIIMSLSSLQDKLVCCGCRWSSQDKESKLSDYAGHEGAEMQGQKASVFFCYLFIYLFGIWELS